MASQMMMISSRLLYGCEKIINLSGCRPLCHICTSYFVLNSSRSVRTSAPCSVGKSVLKWTAYHNSSLFFLDKKGQQDSASRHRNPESLVHITSEESSLSGEESSDTDEDDGKNIPDERKVLLDRFKDTVRLTAKEWDELKTAILESSRIVNEYSYDAFIMGICITNKNLAMGRSYLEYLMETKKDVNVATLSKFLKLCFLCSYESSESEVMNIYEMLRKKSPTMDANTTENVIYGLSITSAWKECLKFMDSVKITCLPSASVYSAVIVAAFRNGENGMGWKFMENMLEEGRRPYPEVFDAWLQTCAANKKTENKKKMFKELLSYFERFDVRPSKDVAENLKNFVENHLKPPWHVEFTSVTTRTYLVIRTSDYHARDMDLIQLGENWDFFHLFKQLQHPPSIIKGNCLHCGEQLKPLVITEEEFQQLKSTFMERAMVGSDVFLKTTPVELERYQKFIKATSPYDIVIDGLNVGYAAGAKQPPQARARLLQSVVKHFINNNDRVLVLGRKHMKTWPQREMGYVYKNASVFLADNLSQDDPFLLYATLHSGLGTKFISRDLMRGHAFRLKDASLMGLFKRWQQQHQIQVNYITNGGIVKLKSPLSYLPVAQGDEESWHVPYDIQFSGNVNMSLEPPENWLCLSSELVKEKQLPKPAGFTKNNRKKTTKIPI